MQSDEKNGEGMEDLLLFFAKPLREFRNSIEREMKNKEIMNLGKHAEFLIIRVDVGSL